MRQLIEVGYELTGLGGAASARIPVVALPPNVFGTPPAIAETTFEAMGTWCHVIVHGGAASALEDAIAHVRDLERRWTRFDPDSELSRANARPGRWSAVSAETIALAQRALLGWRMTDGAFDPFVAHRMAEVGYDRDFDELSTGVRPPAGRGFKRRTPVQVDPVDGRIRILGDGLDSGGIGKGLAADLVAQTLLAQGSAAALVNLGGDLRCAGRAPTGGWQVSLDDAWRPGEESGWWIRLEAGAVATSSPLRRRWTYEDGSVGHHLLDPRTGLSLEPRYAAVSVVARQGWIAEVLTKAAFGLAPRRLARLLQHRAAAAVVTTHDGQRRTLR